MNRFLRRAQYLLHHDRMDAELAEEMEFHRSRLADEGRVPAMGNVTLAREASRGVWIWPWLESLWQDAVYAIRTMRRQPAFTVTALVALGCAIGINTGLFTIFNAIALHPWPVADPSRVMVLSRFTSEGGGDFGIAEYRYLAQHSKTFSGLIAMRNGERVKMDRDTLQLTYVSGNYFGVLGVRMERGRGFLAEEDVTGAPAAVAVVSHDLWSNRLGEDPQIVGRTIRLDDQAFTVVGVAPEEFTGTNPLRNDIWAPLPARKLLRPNDLSVAEWLTSPKVCCSPMAGRLADGVSRSQAEAELAILADQFRTQNRLGGEAPRIVAAGTSWIEAPRKKKQVVPALLTLFIAVTLVLLLACANVGNLLLARAAARRQEIAVRLSLGGSRLRLVRQFLVESALLAMAAAALGLAMAATLPAALMRRVAADQVFHIVPDWRVLLYTIAVATLSALAFGLAPALHGTRSGISAALKGGSGSQALEHTRIPLRSALLALQVAISVILLANAGLLVRGIRRTQGLNPGFDVRNASVLTVDLPASQYSGPRTRALTGTLLTELSQSSDLPAWGLMLNPPLANANFGTSFQQTDRPGSPVLHIYVNEISGGVLDALGMRVLDGRNFVPEDSGRDVLMVNQAAARRFWPGDNPLGKTAMVNNRMRQIVGVVSDTYTNDLSGIEAVLYLPVTGAMGVPSIVVHDRNAPTFERLSAIVKQIEPRAEVHAETLSTRFDRQLQPSIYASEIAGLLGLLALAIASVGISGVFAYVVGQRTKEIGVRMALGARRGQIVRLVLGSSGRALAAGIAGGIVGAAGISALLASAIPGIQPLDALAYCGVVVLLTAAVALASAAPLRRAMRVDPVSALRWE